MARATIVVTMNRAHRGDPGGRRGQAHALEPPQGAPPALRAAAHRLPRAVSPGRSARGSSWSSAAAPTTCARPSARRPISPTSSRRSGSAPGTRSSRRAAPAATARAPSSCCRATSRSCQKPLLERARATTTADAARRPRCSPPRSADADGLRARGPRAGPAGRHRRAPRRDRRPAADPRDRHERVLLRRRALLARAGPGHAAERAGRVLPDRRRLDPASPAGSGSRR